MNASCPCGESININPGGHRDVAQKKLDHWLRQHRGHTGEPETTWPPVMENNDPRASETKATR